MTRFKKITGYGLFLPILCFILVLLINVIKTPSFFEISIKNGVLYGYIIDVINRASELVILAVGMTLVVASSGGTDISVGAVMSVAGAVSCFIGMGGHKSECRIKILACCWLLVAIITVYAALEWILGRKNEDSANGCNFNFVYGRSWYCTVDYRWKYSLY